MNIGIIGMGFVGGTTANVLERAHKIFPYDKYKSPHNSSSHLEELANQSEVIFVSVPTPMKPSGEIDYSSIHNSLDALSGYITNPSEKYVVIRSTAVSGTTDDLSKKYSFQFAFNPEFLREKHALEDMEKTDRIVIGANSSEIHRKVAEVYKPIFPNAEYFFTDTRTAEMVKYAANVFLASQVAIANEMYQICNALGIDYQQVRDIVSRDDRIAKNIDVPGPDGDLGFGGKCFPKDLNALIYLAREHMYRPHLLEEVWRLNAQVRRNKDWLHIDGAVSQTNPDSKKD